MAKAAHLEKVADLDLEDITTQRGVIQVGTIEDIPQIQIYFGESVGIQGGFPNGSLYVDYDPRHVQADMDLVKSIIEGCLAEADVAMTGLQVQRNIVEVLRDAGLTVEAEDLDLNLES